MSFETATDPSIRPPVGASAKPAHARASAASRPEGAEFTFGDFLDVVNPLHHVPVVSHIYRAISGDEISGPARVLGGTLYGGPVGFVFSAIGAIAEEANGEPLIDSAMAMLRGEGEPPAVASQPAPATSRQQQAAAPEAPVVNTAAPTETNAGPASRVPKAPSTDEALAVQAALQAMAAPRESAPAAAAPARIQPTAGAQLHGANALAALAGDLAGDPSLPTVKQDGAPRAGEPATSAEPGGYRLRPEDWRGRKARPAPAAATGKEAPVPQFTQHMMDGLSKYQAMAGTLASPGRVAASTAGAPR